jgi:hypothetical protein
VPLALPGLQVAAIAVALPALFQECRSQLGFGPLCLKATWTMTMAWRSEEEMGVDTVGLEIKLV